METFEGYLRERIFLREFDGDDFFSPVGKRKKKIIVERESNNSIERAFLLSNVFTRPNNKPKDVNSGYPILRISRLPSELL